MTYVLYSQWNGYSETSITKMKSLLKVSQSFRRRRSSGSTAKKQSLNVSKILDDDCGGRQSNATELSSTQKNTKNENEMRPLQEKESTFSSQDNHTDDENNYDDDSMHVKGEVMDRRLSVVTMADTCIDEVIRSEQAQSQEQEHDVHQETVSVKKILGRGSNITHRARLDLENIRVHQSQENYMKYTHDPVKKYQENAQPQGQTRFQMDRTMSFASSSLHGEHRPYRASMFDDDTKSTITTTSYAKSSRSFATYSSEDIVSSSEGDFDTDLKFGMDSSESQRYSLKKSRRHLTRKQKIYLKSKKYAYQYKKEHERKSAAKSLGARLLYPWYIMASLSSLQDTPEATLVTRATFLLMSSLTCVAGLIWSFMYLVLEERMAAVFPTAYSILMSICLIWCCLIPALSKNKKLSADLKDSIKPSIDDFDRFPVVVSVQLFLILVLPICVQLSLGGMVESGGVIIWSFLCPLGAAIFCDNSSTSMTWFCIYLCSIVSTILFETTKIHVGENSVYLSSVHIGYFIMNFVGAFTIIYLGANSFSSKLEEEYSRSELLLQNMLPKSIAIRLKRGENNFADNYSNCTILFADLVGFTQSASELHPNFLIGLFLKDVFMAFDEATEFRGLEKIKTIGDAYMVVGGLGVENKKHRSHSRNSGYFAELKQGHAADVINLAFDFQEALEAINEKYGLDFQIRIGIHTGPVIAGVIGNAKFAFGKWTILITDTLLSFAC